MKIEDNLILKLINLLIRILLFYDYCNHRHYLVHGGRKFSFQCNTWMSRRLQTLEICFNTCFVNFFSFAFLSKKFFSFKMKLVETTEKIIKVFDLSVFYTKFDFYIFVKHLFKSFHRVLCLKRLRFSFGNHKITQEN